MARAIPPLHARDTYIMSPNADNHALPTASAAWAQKFPLAPSLPHFLAKLSSTPRPYKVNIPSKDHRATYFDMLAWLIRYGWVTQLRSFAWVIVWPEIVYEVKHTYKAETLAKTPIPAAQSIKKPVEDQTADEAAENARRERARVKMLEDAEEFKKRPMPVATVHPSTNAAPHLNFAPHIIMDPHKANHMETLYLDAIGKRFKDEKVRKWWPKLRKYFNGRQPLEVIGPYEGMKRKEAHTITVEMQEFLMIVKHW